MNIKELVYEEDLNMFFERIQEDNNLNQPKLVEFIQDIAFGERNLFINDTHVHIWSMQEEIRKKEEQIYDLMDQMQELRNDPSVMRSRNMEEM